MAEAGSQYESSPEILGPSGLPDASSLLSSRWPEDNLVTCDPVRHYSGEIVETVTVESLEQIVRGPLGVSLGLEVHSVRMGVFTWDVSCRSAHGPLMMQVPRVRDLASPSGRRKADVPRQNVENLSHYLRQGLSRYLARPLLPVQTALDFPVSFLSTDSTFRTLTFGSGQARLDLSGVKTDWVIGLGAQLTAEALVEVVAAIAYHFEPEEAGGTTIADLFLNDGDFGLKRLEDDSFALRLSTIRRRETGVSPERLLLHVTQMVAYQDFQVAESLVGVPTLVSNPSIAFEGLCRGRRLRALDLGQDPRLGEEEARSWIAQFSASEHGCAYQPWVRAFLAGELRPKFGDDLRECWWRLLDIAERENVATLVFRYTTNKEDRARAEDLGTLRRKCAADVGRRTFPEPPNWNDLRFDELMSLLESAGEPSERAEPLARSLIKRWPFRDFDHLLAEVPLAKKLRKVRGKSGFGLVMRASDEPDSWRRSEPEKDARPLANREFFGASLVDEREVPAALRLCNTFESYMDSALQDEAWGYYARSVLIGRRGHFTTRPERFSPDYGLWLCSLAFELYRTLRQRGELSQGDLFWIVEFGAGNGRMAADLLLASRGPKPHALMDDAVWSDFSSAIRYRIYEKSALLREKQQEALGDTVQITAGDARRPRESLERDFKEGLRGLVITNEVPDAFGVHKVLLTREGLARAALVVPSLSQRGFEQASAELRTQIGISNRAMREQLSFARREGAFSLDRETFQSVMIELGGLSHAERARRTLELTLDEAYVPARVLPDLREHLARNREQYAVSLAAVDTGVTIYPNPHADRCIEELGECLVAGFVVTIDYGADSLELFRSARRGEFLFRVFLDGSPFSPIANDPYLRVGVQDLTADVNFTALALAGKRAGMEVIHYGPERDLVGPFLPALMERRFEPLIAEFLGSPFFKVLIQSPKPGAIDLGPLATPLAYLAETGDLSSSERSRFERLAEVMARDLVS